MGTLAKRCKSQTRPLARRYGSLHPFHTYWHILIAFGAAPVAPSQIAEVIGCDRHDVRTAVDAALRQWRKGSEWREMQPCGTSGV